MHEVENARYGRPGFGLLGLLVAACLGGAVVSVLGGRPVTAKERDACFLCRNGSRPFGPGCGRSYHPRSTSGLVHSDIEDFRALYHAREHVQRNVAFVKLVRGGHRLLPGVQLGNETLRHLDFRGDVGAFAAWRRSHSDGAWQAKVDVSKRSSGVIFDLRAFRPGAAIESCRFSDCDLSGLTAGMGRNFEDCTWGSCSMAHSKLSNLGFRKVSFRSVDFASSEWFSVSFGPARVSDAEPKERTRFDCCRFDCSSWLSVAISAGDFVDCSFDRMSTPEHMYRGNHFKDCSFVGCSFRLGSLRASFENCRFENCRFEGADLSETYFYGRLHIDPAALAKASVLRGLRAPRKLLDRLRELEPSKF